MSQSTVRGSAAAVATLALLVSACGGKSNTAAGTSASTSASATASLSASVSAGLSVPSGGPGCPSAATVGTAFGGTWTGPTSKVPAVVPQVTAVGCGYILSTGGAAAVTIETFASSVVEAYAKAALAQDTAVAGIGDSAYLNANHNTLVVISGLNLITVTYQGGTTAQLEALARAIG